MSRIYLDHASTTPLHPEVLQAMLPYMMESYGNASSLHEEGRIAKLALSESRDHISALLHCKPGELLFTSGGTESNNLAIRGSVQTINDKKHIITSQVEHHAVLNTCAQLETLGYDVTYLPVDTYGQIDYDQLKSAIRPETCLISLMYGNNEVGTLQPIVQAGELAREHGIIMHVDAVQALGKLLINLTELPIDLASFSAHKLNGPKGVGALYISAQRQLIPQQFGGSQERKRRAGTENVAGIVGFSKAVQMAINHMDEISNHLKKLGLLFIQELEQQIGTESFFHNGHLEEKLPHIYNVSFPAIDTETMLMNLDLAGIAASSGSACASGSLELSHVLRAMRLPMDRMNSAIRFSFGTQVSSQDVHKAVNTIATILDRIRNR